MDCGAQVDWYNGDISRTFPVNGKFTERQKLVYNIVLEGQQKVIDAIRPGQPFSRLNEILKEHYLEALKEIGLVKTMADVAKYYYHGVSHYLGAETHDIGRYTERVLQPGMVLTVEPGLYIEEWGIGIRIEDDALVTEDGCEIMTKDMIKGTGHCGAEKILSAKAGLSGIGSTESDGTGICCHSPSPERSAGEKLEKHAEIAETTGNRSADSGSRQSPQDSGCGADAFGQLGMEKQKEAGAAASGIGKQTGFRQYRRHEPQEDCDGLSGKSTVSVLYSGKQRSRYIWRTAGNGTGRKVHVHTAQQCISLV